MKTQISFMLTAFVLVLSSGCSKEDAGGNAALQDARPATENDQTALSEIQESDLPRVLSEFESGLVGIWVGGAFIEEGLVDSRIANLPESERATVRANAQTFLTTVMAIQFNSNGTMEQHVEITLPDGNKEDLIGVGVWRVTERQDEYARVELIEIEEDGTEVITERICQFSADGNQFAFAAPVSDELATCNAMLVFNRETMPVNRTADATASEPR